MEVEAQRSHSLLELPPQSDAEEGTEDAKNVEDAVGDQVKMLINRVLTAAVTAEITRIRKQYAANDKLIDALNRIAVKKRHRLMTPVMVYENLWQPPALELRASEVTHEQKIYGDGTCMGVSFDSMLHGSSCEGAGPDRTSTLHV